MQQAGVQPSLLEVFRSGSHAVVGAKGDDVISATDLLVEMGEKIGEIFVEADENVLNLAAARTEGVAHAVHGGVAYAEKIGPGAAAQVQSVDGFFRKLR